VQFAAIAPSFEKRPLQQSVSAAIGSQTRIQCSPEAAPKPEFSWTLYEMAAMSALNFLRLFLFSKPSSLVCVFSIEKI